MNNSVWVKVWRETFLFTLFTKHNVKSSVKSNYTLSLAWCQLTMIDYSKRKKYSLTLSKDQID